MWLYIYIYLYSDSLKHIFSKDRLVDMISEILFQSHRDSSKSRFSWFRISSQKPQMIHVGPTLVLAAYQVRHQQHVPKWPRLHGGTCLQIRAVILGLYYLFCKVWINHFHISIEWGGANSRNPSMWNTSIYISYLVDTLAIDGMAMQGTMDSATFYWPGSPKWYVLVGASEAGSSCFFQPRWLLYIRCRSKVWRVYNYTGLF